MKVKHVHIINYRGLKDVSMPLSECVCITGENNAGKSSVLQAISHFLNGPTLRETDYYDPTHGITIEITFGEITNDDLQLLAEEHRARIISLVDDEHSLTLVRRYGTDRKSEFGSMSFVPIEERFAPENVSKLLEKKSGRVLKDAVALAFPELQEQAAELSSQTAAKALIEDYGNKLPIEQKEFKFRKLISGIDESILPMLPEGIYIPAVKDLSDETKTAQTTPFGKILAIVMKAIEPQLAEEKELFERLSKKLNRSFGPDGIEVEGRLPQLANIEKTIQDYVRQSFANVSLEIEVPPPDLKSVLATTRILADDGVKGPLEFKGDGLRRAVVFSILRAYVDLARGGNQNAESTSTPERGYWLLFEEPELFLHPDAQKILFDALSVFAEKHHVIVTTHSPLFLGPKPTATFIRLSKIAESKETKPYTKAYHANMDGLALRDEFQLIGFESNNAAFFARRVVLVEGDCDFLVFPHIALTLNDKWNCKTCSVAFVRVGGKGNFRRYKNFFLRFDVPVYSIADLDAFESDSFQLLDPTETAKQLHSTLMQKVFTSVNQTGETSKVRTRDIAKAQTSSELVALWDKVRSAKEAYDNDRSKFSELDAAMETFFSWEKKSAYRECLRKAEHDEIREAKLALIWELRKSNVFVLERGAVEDYYPSDLLGEKLQKALNFCKVCDSVEWLCSLHPPQTCPNTGKVASEFEFICTPIFT